MREPTFEGPERPADPLGLHGRSWPVQEHVQTRHRPRYRLAILLFLLTCFTTTTLGGVVHLATRTDATIDVLPLLTPTTVQRVWSDPALLRLGLAFSVPLLLILTAHELGHYVACRRYRIPATVPYFLPAPFFIGTFGAFIRIRGQIRDRRRLFDVGIAGPIAGFAVLLPFLILGVARSEPGVVHLAANEQLADAILYRPGSNLALAGLTRLFHGPGVTPATLDLHPFALAAWVGLLATALNLLPLGQLDGGHVLYAVSGAGHRWLSWPLWLGLVLLGLQWQGWLLWSGMVLLMGLRHPPVGDPSPLDPLRRRLALVAPLMLALCFIPEPLDYVLVQDPPALLAATEGH
ncbi:MAG: site-2 protease family protein [Thermoanaerobaculia bacterium]|nr:site-2 protease family protein [Thermoanaerobaculia bacterium]